MFDSEMVEETEILVVDFVSRKLVYKGTLDNVSEDRKSRNKETLAAVGKAISLIDTKYKEEVLKKAA